MLAIGFALAWVAYGHIVYAAALITGKNVSYKQVWSLTTWPPKSKGIACGGKSSGSSAPGYSPGSTAAPTGVTPRTSANTQVATGTTQAPGTTTAGGRG
jgi:hypothetical protein